MSDQFSYIIRPVVARDIPALNSLAQTLYFLNLPRDHNEMAEKVQRSMRSFQNKNLPDEIAEFFFVLTDKHETLLGSSLILSKHGTPDDPHTFFQTQRIEHYSQELHTGLIHETLNLQIEEDGPTEIGGLIIDKSLRHHPRKLGKCLSFVRFNFMKRNPNSFQNEVLAEMMAPVTAKGENVLWEAVGRNFTNLSYDDADKFSVKHKEMIRSLFPKSPIYLTLLKAEVRHSIGEVGKDTIPAKRLLESQGFAYTGQLDPFDGGPHLRCVTSNIKAVKETCKKSNLNGIDLKTHIISFGQGLDFHALPCPTEDDIKLLQSMNIKEFWITPIV